MLLFLPFCTVIGGNAVRTTDADWIGILLWHNLWHLHFFDKEEVNLSAPTLPQIASDPSGLSSGILTMQFERYTRRTLKLTRDMSPPFEAIWTAKIALHCLQLVVAPSSSVDWLKFQIRSCARYDHDHESVVACSVSDCFDVYSFFCRLEGLCQRLPSNGRVSMKRH